MMSHTATLNQAMAMSAGCENNGAYGFTARVMPPNDQAQRPGSPDAEQT
jgi:hypothetical protein